MVGPEAPGAASSLPHAPAASESTVNAISPLTMLGDACAGRDTGLASTIENDSQ